jgi:hypothetical protein
MLKMNKTELIEKISESAGVSENEQKLFFEILLRRCAEELVDGGTLPVYGLGRFEYRMSFDENEIDSLVFIINDNEELTFDIPEKEESVSAESIDSHFSISIGKPIIPFKGENKLFIPHSDDEFKRMLELKVEKFIEDASKPEIYAGDAGDLEDIKFSFLKIGKSPDLEDEINKIEQNLDESFNAEDKSETAETEDESESLIGTTYLYDEEPEKIEDEILEEIIDIESEKPKFTEINDNELIEVEDSEKVDEELIYELAEEPDELPEVPADEIIKESKYGEEEILEEVNNKFKSSFTKEKKRKSKIKDPAIIDAFKYAEEKMARLESFSKKSYGTVIFTMVIILATAALLYFSFYSKGIEKNPGTDKSALTKSFNVVVERSYDIPVSYPYRAGMFGGVYKAINDDVLKPEITDESAGKLNTQTTAVETAKIPEVRSPLPSTRIKGYIYRYNDGTYAAQISSWRTKMIAVSETQKYLNAGYNAFIEQTLLEGEAYYRVRVGGFKSLDEVEKFLNY